MSRCNWRAPRTKPVAAEDAKEFAKVAKTQCWLILADSVLGLLSGAQWREIQAAGSFLRCAFRAVD